jgi:hypothetical protein
MEERIKAFIKSALESSNKNNKGEIIEEIYANTIERYNDLLKKGNDPDKAFELCVSNLGNLTRTVSNDLFDESLRKSKVTIWTILFLSILSVISMFFYSPAGYVLFGIALLSFLVLLLVSYKDYRTHEQFGDTENAKRHIAIIADYIFPLCLIWIIASTCCLWDGFFRFLFDLGSTTSIDWLTKIDPLWFVFLLFFVILAVETIIIGYPAKLLIAKVNAILNDSQIKNLPKWCRDRCLTNNIKYISHKKVTGIFMQCSIFVLLVFLFASKVRVYDLLPSISLQGVLVLIETEYFWTYFIDGNLFQVLIPIFVLYISYIVLTIFGLFFKKINTIKLWNVFSFAIIGVLILTQFILLWKTENRISIHGSILFAILSLAVSNLYVKYLNVVGTFVYE